MQVLAWDEDCGILALNLALNALQLTPAGDVVTMSAAIAGQTAVQQVEDSGEGIPAEEPAVCVQSVLSRRPVTVPRIRRTASPSARR